MLTYGKGVQFIGDDDALSVETLVVSTLYFRESVSRFNLPINFPIIQTLQELGNPHLLKG